LANLARQVEAVDHTAYARFLPSWQKLGDDPRTSLLDVMRQLSGVAIPASIFEADVLSARLPNPQPDLDTALAAGDVVWIGREPLGSRDGRISVYLREGYPLLAPPAPKEPPDGPTHLALLAHLEAEGASFFQDLYRGVGGGDPDNLVEALWDLVWSGSITSDSMAALRAYTARRRSRTRSRRSLPSASPTLAAGRWYLTRSLLTFQPTAEERSLATIEALLDRHGIITRNVVLAEGVPGGFTGLYPALVSLEDIGRLRRGYFIDAAGGAQFGLPGAIDQLRSVDTSELMVLQAADPASPFGFTIPWPDTEGRPTRTAGARIATAHGSLIAWMDGTGRRVCTFSDDLPRTAAAIEALALAHGSVSLSHIGATRIYDHELAAGLLDLGFNSGYKGFTLGTQGHSSRRSL
jgi:ATP-dependent Lhr-like helicase